MPKERVRDGENPVGAAKDGALDVGGEVRIRKRPETERLGAERRVHFEQEDSLSGKGIYELRVVSAAPERLVFDTRNLTTLRYLMIPMFHPGDVESIYFVERESKDVWRYYNIARLGEHSSPLTAGHAASSVNRAVAFYRWLSGIPLTTEPPAAR